MNKKYYSIECICNKQSYFMLWFSNDDKDGIYIDKNKQVIYFKTFKLLNAYALSKDIYIEKEEPAIYNIDKVIEWVENGDGNNLDCVEILLFWNLIIDFANSVEEEFNTDKSKSHKVYDKLFWGNNLPPVTPEGKHYIPIWDNKEIKIIKDIIKHGLRIFRSTIKN